MTERIANDLTLAIVAVSLILQGISEYRLWRYMHEVPPSTRFGMQLNRKFFAFTLELLLLGSLYAVAALTPWEKTFVHWAIRITIASVAIYTTIVIQRLVSELRREIRSQDDLHV